MNALREGFRAIQRNLPALAVYMLIIAAISTIAVGIGYLVAEETRTSPFSAYTIVRTVIAIIATAVAQTLVFTWMSQEMGRPLWKLSTRESFQRFFPLWLIVQVIENAVAWVIQIVGETTGDRYLTSNLIFLFIPVFILTTPIGACLMKSGQLSRSSIPEALRPLVDLLPQTMVVLLFAALILFFLVFLSAGSALWLRPLIGIIAVYFDAVIFASTWAICAYHEHSYEGPDDIDF